MAYFIDANYVERVRIVPLPPASVLTTAQKATCRIDRTGGGHGSGFHWGNGWILTNSHVLLGVSSPSDSLDYDNVEMRRLKFSFPEGEVFECQDRVAIVVDPNEGSRNGIPDLALIKLGCQVEYGRVRESVQKWEADEAARISRIPGLASLQENGNTKMQVYVTHYGTGGVHLNADAGHPPPPLPLQQSGCGTVLEVDGQTFKHTSFTSPGSSGSPVLCEETHRVVGVSVSGTDEWSVAVNLEFNDHDGIAPVARLFLGKHYTAVINKMETKLLYGHMSQFVPEAEIVVNTTTHELLQLENDPQIQVHLFLPLDRISFTRPLPS